MRDPALGGGCAHHFCKACLLQWCQTKPNCPVCRAPVWCVVSDHEYANALGCEPAARESSGAQAPAATTTDLEETTDPAHSDGPGTRRVKVNGPAGLVLAQRGTKVVIGKCIPGNGAHLAGLKSGEILLKVNGAVVHDHRLAVSFVEQRCAAGDCELTLREPRRSSLSPLSNMFSMRGA